MLLAEKHEADSLKSKPRLGEAGSVTDWFSWTGDSLCVRKHSLRVLLARKVGPIFCVRESGRRQTGYAN